MSNFQLVKDQVIVGVMANGLAASLERIGRGLYEAERMGRCGHAPWFVCVLTASLLHGTATIMCSAHTQDCPPP